MKLSSYTICVEQYPTPDENLYYNTRTQAMVKVNNELKGVLEDYYNPKNFSLKLKYSDELIQLHKIGIMVLDEEEDRQKIDSFLNDVKHNIDKECLQVTILTTFACNLECVYCFEEGARKDEHMKRSTSDDVINWIKNEMNRCGYKNLSVTFYGGEPLLNKIILEYIAVKLKAWCKATGKGFKFSLQTNGYNLTPEVVDRLLEVGLSRVRVSVDGLAHIHDKNRPLRGGGGSFDRIIENILASVDKVRTCISTCYEADDITHIEELLAYFKKIGILHKIDDFMFSPIQPSLGPKDNPGRIRMKECMCNYDDDILIRANKKIISLMNSLDLPSRIGMTITMCPLTMHAGGFTIDQRGNIFKCNSMLGYQEFSAGHVKDANLNEKSKEFINLEPWKKCNQDCQYLPMCSGGVIFFMLFICRLCTCQ